MKINLTKEQMLYAEDMGKKRHEIDINLNAKGGQLKNMIRPLIKS